MKAEELRIGNYVSLQGYEFKIDVVDILVFLQEKLTYEPIPLTEEWLKKSKAVQFKEFWSYSRFKLIWKESYKYWYVVDLQDSTYLTKIEFVHEWQNFLFVMNGEELKTIKP